MNTKDFLFFSKEGYPHNFQYNQDTESWEGKIIFDENSDQTFKTQSLHVFEEVAPIDFAIDADLIALNYNNNSGITFAGETGFENEIITNIVKVNDSDEFYSKWIYGDSFHKKFPIGTIISFSGVTGTTTDYTDFSDDQFFTVLTTKKNAFLIITNTSNDVFNFSIISGYTSSINMISINDYNRDLTGQTFFQNLYTDKKFSIINSDYNDSVFSVKQTGLTYSYLNEIKISGITNQIFTLSIQFFNERIKVLQNDVTLTSSQYLNLGRNSYQLAPETGYTSGGITIIKKEIIFEDSNGAKLYNGCTFVVDDLVTTEYIGTKQLTIKRYIKDLNNYQYNNVWTNEVQWNTIQYSGSLNLRNGDVILLSGVTLSGLTGSTFLMNNREFSISTASYNATTNTTVLLVPGYIIDEDNSAYNIIKKLQPYQITTVKVSTLCDVSAFNNILVKDAYCYLTSTLVNFNQVYTTGYTNSVSYNTIEAFIKKYKAKLYEYGIDSYHTIKNNSDYLSIESLYGTNTKYCLASGYTNNKKLPDDFSLTNNGLTTKFNIITSEKIISEKTNKSDPNLYKTEASSVILLNLNNDNDRFGFKLTLNSDEYSIDYSIDTPTTINKFIDVYGETMLKNGFIISVSSGYTLENVYYTGYTLNITSDVDIWNLEMLVNILSSYQILQHERNQAILLSGNEIRSNYVNLFDLELATGMIVKISGSSFSENNKEYNIIKLTEDVIGLSYQGVFTSENNILITGKTREFIRKPRSEYNRDIYLRVFWEVPVDNVIDKSIFLYDITGEQLIPYNNIQALKYIGIKPLIDPLQNNVVFLNEDSNKYLAKVSDPKAQQTIFNELYFKLEQLDSSLSYNWIPEPLEIFIGYNSSEEGVNNRNLKIEKIEKLENNDQYFSYTGYTDSGTSMSLNNFTFNIDTVYFSAPIDFSFISYGFEKDQLISFYFKDQSKKNQRIFENVFTYKIKDLSRNKITIDTEYTYKNNIYDTGYTYNSTGFTYFISTGATFFFKIEVQPKEILSCSIYGQTEIEDIRYKINLNNLGVQSEDDVYEILYLSDIEDNAIDYTLFNRKRKEMLTTFREIYDYIGSYKSLINSINYFGYNDLFLYEYYKNIDQSSPLNGKLHKVLIPDIFDNTVQGWNEMDFIAGKYQNQNTWKKTNLFNLAYRITDEDGNNVLIYTLEEVQYKLTKLKKWLRKNIIPISANLIDITGVADTTHVLYQDYDESNQTIKSVLERNSTVINFNYTATLNFGSDYLITVNFYILSGSTLSNNYTGPNYSNFYGNTDNAEINIDYNETPLSYSVKIKTFFLSGNTYLNATDTLVPVQYFKIFKTDLTSFSFNLNKYQDPYIYVETTTYDNTGNGIGYVNNKLFYFDEPRNYWLVTNNFDLTKMRYWQNSDYITNKHTEFIANDIIDASTVISTQVETIVKANILNKNYVSQIPKNS